MSPVRAAGEPRRRGRRRGRASRRSRRPRSWSPPSSSFTTAAVTWLRRAVESESDQVSRPAKTIGTRATSATATASLRRGDDPPAAPSATAAPAGATSGAGTSDAGMATVIGQAIRPSPRAPNGHQDHSPTSVVIAGTRIERTTKVSISTPTATVAPTWNEHDQRRAGHRPERAGQDEAGRRDDRAGPPGRDPDAVADRPALALLADPAHQEDVVVGAERDQQHEDHQRQEEVDPGLAEDRLEEPGGEARARWGTRAGRCHQVERGHDGPQQEHQHDQDAEDRDDGHALEVRVQTRPGCRRTRRWGRRGRRRRRCRSRSRPRPGRPAPPDGVEGGMRVRVVTGGDEEPGRRAVTGQEGGDGRLDLRAALAGGRGRDEQVVRARRELCREQPAAPSGSRPKVAAISLLRRVACGGAGRLFGEERRVRRWASKGRPATRRPARGPARPRSAPSARGWPRRPARDREGAVSRDRRDRRPPSSSR